jgi:hypothetical protein
VSEGGHQWLYRPPIADLAQRQCGRLAHCTGTVFQYADQRFHGSRIADLAQRLDCATPARHAPFLKLSEKWDHGPRVADFSKCRSGACTNGRICIREGGDERLYCSRIPLLCQRPRGRLTGFYVSMAI